MMLMCSLSQKVAPSLETQLLLLTPSWPTFFRWLRITLAINVSYILPMNKIGMPWVQCNASEWSRCLSSARVPSGPLVSLRGPWDPSGVPGTPQGPARTLVIHLSHVSLSFRCALTWHNKSSPLTVFVDLQHFLCSNERSPHHFLCFPSLRCNLVHCNISCDERISCTSKYLHPIDNFAGINDRITVVVSGLTHYRPAMPLGKRGKYFRGFFQLRIVTISKISPLWNCEI